VKIDIVRVGELKCNCYILDIDNKVLIVDPGDDALKIVDAVGDRDVIGIIITHYHFDHIGALDELVNKYGVSVYDKSNMCEGNNRVGKFVFEVIYTPGHKEDAITIYFKEDKCMFCGDFIFRDSIGRCDLPGGNIREMVESIKKIKKYDKDIDIYPGHGNKTTLEYEINNNMYFLDISLL